MNMVEIDSCSLRKWQLLQFKILKEFKRICEKNNIKYILVGGTLIGAVRHKGFIPWDDDVDVALLRADYEKFKNVCQFDLGDEFFFRCPDTDPECPVGAKLTLKGTKYISHTMPLNMKNCGISIDVLVYDNVSDKKLYNFFYCNWYHILLRILLKRYGYKPNPGKLWQRVILNICNFFFSFVSTNRLREFCDTYPLKFSRFETKNVCIFSGIHGYPKEKHLRTTVENIKEMEFEGEYFSVPIDYDIFLREQYGDYMKLPDEDKRKLRHHCQVLDFGIYQ